MGNNSQSIINVICSMTVLCINLFMGFWLSPFVIRTIGVEANGFISLAGNFITYAALIDSALASMGSRFVTIEYVKGNFEKANIYYNSLFWSRLVIIAVLIVPAIYLIARLESFVKIPPELLKDVKVLFGVMFASFLAGLAVPMWSVATYATNKLHRSYIPSALTALLRAVLVFGMFTLMTPKVYYLAIASTVITVISVIINWYNKKKLIKELSLKFKKGERIYSLKAVWELTSSGVWNSVSSVGHMFLSGLDLLVCNIYLGPTAMGVVALSKTLPSHMQGLSGTICGAFSPSITIGYAKGNMEAIYHELRKAMKMTSFIMIIPIAGIVTFGDWFYSLWVPSQDARLLQTLSVLGITGYMFTSGTQILYNVFAAVNKVKQNSIAMLVSGTVSIGMMLFLVNFTELGILVFGGVSMVVNLVRNMSFTLPATASYLGFNRKRFYPQVGQTVFASLVLIALGLLMKPFLSGDSWWHLCLSVLIFTAIAAPVSFYILFNKGERQFLKEKLAAKLKAPFMKLFKRKASAL